MDKWSAEKPVTRLTEEQRMLAARLAVNQVDMKALGIIRLYLQETDPDFDMIAFIIAASPGIEIIQACLPDLELNSKLQTIRVLYPLIVDKKWEEIEKYAEPFREKIRNEARARYNNGSLLDNILTKGGRK